MGKIRYAGLADILFEIQNKGNSGKMNFIRFAKLKWQEK